MSRLEHLCVQYLEACIGHRNVLAALQNAARLKLDYIKVRIHWGRGLDADNRPCLQASW